MRSVWGAVDLLMREGGGLRNEARTLGPAATNTAAAEVEGLIAAAAQAVDDTIVEPESEPLLLGACAAIVEAREQIAALQSNAARAGQLVARSIELRRVSARVLYDSIRRRSNDEQDA
jgi:hypothetical protein